MVEMQNLKTLQGKICLHLHVWPKNTEDYRAAKRRMLSAGIKGNTFSFIAKSGAMARPQETSSVPKHIAGPVTPAAQPAALPAPQRAAGKTPACDPPNLWD